MLISLMVQAAVSVKRMNKFLSSDELDHYVRRSDSPTSPTAVSIERGVFAWSKSERNQPTLKNINLEVPRGKLIAIVGTVGSGKSSLLSALLGFMEKVEGEVELNGNSKKNSRFFGSHSSVMVPPVHIRPLNISLTPYRQGRLRCTADMDSERHAERQHIVQQAV